MFTSEVPTRDTTSSIGAIWPPEHTSHSRLRGFYTDGVVRTADDIATFTEHFARGRERISDGGIDRLSVRLVTHAGNLAVLEAKGITVEAALPLARLTEPDLVIAYTGYNASSRCVSATHVAQHGTLLAKAATRQPTTRDRTKHLRTNDLTPHILNERSSQSERAAMVPHFLGLYAAFNYDEAQVATLLTNPNNAIAYIRDEAGDVVSTALAEEATVCVKDLEPLTLVEITEASTRPDYRGKGLYATVSGYLIDSILSAREGRGINTLYSEGNLAEPGVIFAARDNGRQFSHCDAKQYEITRPDFGILPQNFQVAGGTETRPYNDFAVSYTPLR